MHGLCEALANTIRKAPKEDALEEMALAFECLYLLARQGLLPTNKMGARELAQARGRELRAIRAARMSLAEENNPARSEEEENDPQYMALLDTEAELRPEDVAHWGAMQLPFESPSREQGAQGAEGGQEQQAAPAHRFAGLDPDPRVQVAALEECGLGRLGELAAPASLGDRFRCYVDAHACLASTPLLLERACNIIRVCQRNAFKDMSHVSSSTSMHGMRLQGKVIEGRTPETRLQSLWKQGGG